MKTDWLAFTAPFLKEAFAGDAGRENYDHTFRVYILATAIHGEEGGNLDLIQLGALLHDLDDHRLFGGRMGASERVRTFLFDQQLPVWMIEELSFTIEDLCFRAKQSKIPRTLEGQIVQDADRLDAMGALGIARAFAQDARLGKPMYYAGEEGYQKLGLAVAYVKEPSAAEAKAAKERASRTPSTINRFFEELLLLADKMNTPTGMYLAQDRRRFMQMYMEEFFEEWEGFR